MNRFIVWTSLVKLECIDTLGSEVYLCVTPTKIVPSSNPFAINAILNKWTTVRGDSYYRYTFEYDDTQVTSPLVESDVTGAICKDCLTDWVSGNSPIVTEIDPVFNAWLLATPPLYTESDPIFSGSPAGTITYTDIANWNMPAGPEVDPVFNAWLLTSPLSGYVPYVGATADVDLGVYDITSTNVNATTRIVIGNSVASLSATSPLEVVGVGSQYLAYFSEENAPMRWVQVCYSNTAGDEPQFNMWHARGTRAVPTMTQDGDKLGTISFAGYNANGGTFYAGARIQAIADGEWGTGGDLTDSPTKLIFFTSPDGSSSLVQRLVIKPDGSIYVMADNQKLYFGTGQDAYFEYDGTNFICNPKAVGSGIFDVQGTLQTDGYNAADGTAGASATPSGLTFKNGLYTAGSVSGTNSFGTTTQIPYMNAGGTDFLYSAGNIFDGSAHISSNFQTGAVTTGSEKISNGTFNSADTTGWTLNTGWFAGYIFTVSGITTAPGIGSTWTNNGITYTARYSSLTGTAPNRAGVLWMSGAGNPTASGTLTKASGTGDATIAFSANSGGLVFHGATGTGVFSQASGSMVSAPVVGEYYQLQFTTQYKTGTVTPSFAGVTLPATSGGSGTFTYNVKATTTGGLSFTPSSSARISIDNITIKKVDGNIYGGGQLLLTGTIGSGQDTPIYGEGARLMWLPKYAAFRAGSVDGDQWNNSNIGIGSTGLGINVKVSGNASFGSGSSVDITGAQSCGIGDTLGIYNDNSVVLGISSYEYGGMSFIVGTGNNNHGVGCGIIGTNNAIDSALNDSSVIVGSLSLTSGNSVGTVQMGMGNTIENGSPYTFNVGGSHTVLSGAGYGAGNIGYGCQNGSLSGIAAGAYNYAGSVYAPFAGGYGAAATGDGAFIWVYNQAADAFTTQSALASGEASFVVGSISDGVTIATISAAGKCNAVIGGNLQGSGDYQFMFGKTFAESTNNSFNLGWGQRDFQVISGETKFGGNVAGQDYVMTFLGETNDGEFKWMEDEDYFSFTDKVLFADKVMFTQTDGNEYIDSLADGYLDYRATTGHRFGDGTNQTQFNSDGHQTMAGTAQPWEDLRIEPVARTTGTGAPTFEKYFDDAAGTSVGVFLYSFTDESVAGNEKQVFFTMQMPHAWNGGAISIHVHFTPSATVNSSDILWGLEYAWKDIGETYGDTTIVTSSTTLIPDDANITAGKHYIAEFADISPGTTADGLSSILIGRLFRNSSAAGDTYTDKVGLLYIDAHYQINSLGSTDEYTK